MCFGGEGGNLACEGGQGQRCDGESQCECDLCRVFPHRSMDSVKGLRKSVKYTVLRERLLANEPHNESLPAEPPESPVKDFSTENTARRWTTPEPKDRRGPKVRWSDELLDEVARWEARLSRVGCVNMNVKISDRFPERSFDGIEDMRRLAKYKKRVANFLETGFLLDTLPEIKRSPPERGRIGTGDMPLSDKDECNRGEERPPYDCGEMPPVPPCNPGAGRRKSIRPGRRCRGGALP